MGQDSDVRPTLARHSFGGWLLAERQRRGLTRRELVLLMRRADKSLGTTEKAVERWELHGVIPRPASLRALAVVLGKPVEELTALARGGREPTTVERYGAVLLDDDRMAYVLAHPERIDGQMLDQLAALTRMYVSNAQSVSPGVLLPEVVRLMRRIETILTGSHREGVRRRLTTLYAEAAIAAGRLAFWGDDRGQARDLLKLGGRLADELDENQLRALALAFRADLYSGVPYIGTIPGNTNLALSLFDEAAALDAPDWPPLLRSWVLGCRAEEYAALKRANESDRDMEAAHTALAAARGQPASDLVVDVAPLDLAAATFGLSGFEGACALALGRAREARESFERGLKEASSVGRLSGLAAAYALENDVESAVELLTRGLEEAVARQLPTRLRRVEGVRVAYLSRAQDHPAVQRFDQQLRTAIR